MTIAALEEKFQSYLKNNKEKLPLLQDVAEKVLNVQQGMRHYLDKITSIACKECENPCCLLMPVEGWFTEYDYYLFRIFYQNPSDLINGNRAKGGCVFLGKDGCELPGNMRSFTCVRVNCKTVKEILRKKGWEEQFNKLYNKLSLLQEQTWTLIK